ncbi:MAG: M3 family oligoendopeptidase [Candidatus Muirbacterium halophilum]|nr:M3 family oligoendopeptidase [Candidatus Muirbacterium halophilum]MCK9475956.1 M3 family oligoendopeptidase [Candidatus Muirbacterium halophilum]
MKFNEMTYARPDIDKVKEDFEKLLKDFSKAENAETQLNIINNVNKIRNNVSSMQTIASIRNSIDSNDKFYDEEMSFFDKVNPEIQEVNTKFYKELINSKFRPELEKTLGKHIFNIATLEIKTFDKKIMKDLQKENEYVTKYNKLTSSAKIMFEGKERNLAGMTPFMQNKNREIRKQASIALWGWFEQNSKELDEIYDILVKTRTTIAHKLGYKNFVKLGYDRLGRSDYNTEMVANYRKQIKELIVPLAIELRQRQAKRIGIKSLKSYDESFLFNSGNPDPIGNSSEIIQNAKKMYNEMSEETKEFFNFMLDNNLMDLETKKGKRPGGYCTYIPDYKAPFIFSNFNGTRGDVDVLTHEAGHAFQSFRSRNYSTPEYQFPTLEACEIHSMSMEFIAWPWMKNFFGENTEKYKFVHLSDSLLFLPYGACVDEFQHFIYENPEATPKQRKSKWIELTKIYMPWRDYDGIKFAEEGGIWQKQLHIYCVPFYYIDYTLAQVCALQFWKKDRENHEKAWNDYLTLCNAGGSKSFVELVKLANLKLPFNDGCIAEVIKPIKQYLDSIDDTKM